MRKVTMLNNQKAKIEILSAIKVADRILLCSHIMPDGDTLGSTLALMNLLEKLGKKCVVSVDGIIPDNLMFMPGVEHFVSPEHILNDNFDLVISVDVSCIERLGSLQAVFERAEHTIVIDHHNTNPKFGEINFIEGGAAATAILIGELYEEAKLDFTVNDAILLYTALSTDTGNFSFENTDSESFMLMAKLMKANLPLSMCSNLLFRQKEIPFVKLLGIAIRSLRMSDNGQIAGFHLTCKQMDEVNANGGHTDGIVNYAMDIKGVKMAYLLREIGDNRVKGSLRAISPYRIDTVAALYGGGGHALASGMTLDGELDEAVISVETALADARKQQELKK